MRRIRAPRQCVHGQAMQRVTAEKAPINAVKDQPTWGATSMSIGNTTLDELREVNLSYLMLSQRLLRDDRAMGMFRLGVSEQLADVLINLTLAQTVRLASSNQLLCRFRFDDHAILSNLTHSTKNVESASSHAAILLAGQPAEQLG